MALADVSESSEMLREQLSKDSERLKAIEEALFDTAETCGIELRFSAQDEADARSIAQALFAKGARLLTPDPEGGTEHRWQVRASVWHSPMEITAESYVKDMLQMAADMRGRYEGWEILQTAPETSEPGAESGDRR